MTRTDPSVEQVRRLPLATRLVVPADWTDANGHLNIVSYMRIHNDGGWAYMARFGLGEQHAREGTAGCFDIEHHLHYLREVNASDTVALHIRVLERTDKALHLLHYLVNDTTDVLANTLEVVCLSVDMTARRSAPFPARVAARIDDQLASDAAVGWTTVTETALRS